MQDDTPDGALDPGAMFQDLLAQRRDLSACEGGARGVQPQLLEQYVGGGGHKPTPLIGEEARAAGAIDLEPVV